MVTLHEITWTAGFTNVFMCFIYVMWACRSPQLPGCKYHLSTHGDKNVNKPLNSSGYYHWMWTQLKIHHCTSKSWFFIIVIILFYFFSYFPIGFDIKLLSSPFLEHRSRKPEHSPCHLELDVSHICSYGYLCVCACVRVCMHVWGEGRPLYVALYRKKGTLW